MQYFLKLVIGCFGVIACAFCVFNAFKYQQLHHRKNEDEVRRVTVLNPFRAVKEGRTTATISDLSLLEMLADDSDCIENLASATFSSVSFRTSDGPKLEMLQNLIFIGFYDCRNVDSVISKCVGSQVHTISLETTPLSQESIEMLRKAGSIDVSINGHDIREK